MHKTLQSWPVPSESVYYRTEVLQVGNEKDNISVLVPHKYDQKPLDKH